MLQKEKRNLVQNYQVLEQLKYRQQQIILKELSQVLQCH